METKDVQLLEGPSRTLAWVNRENVSHVQKLLDAGKVDGVGVSPEFGGNDCDISYVQSLSGVRAISLPSAKLYDVSVLESFENLEYLLMADNEQPIDFGRFQKLKELRVTWWKGMLFPEKLPLLTSLYLRGLRPHTKDLTCLPNCSKLRCLELVRGTVDCLRGVEVFKVLRKANFSYLSKLKSVEALTQTTVQSLEFGNCQKISDFESLAKCKQLKRLLYNSCGSLASLEFLADFPKLENFRFVKTKVLDGDMSPLLKLKKVGFFRQRGYSHSPEEIEAAIEARLGHSANR